jgi:hypothetical protein
MSFHEDTERSRAERDRFFAGHYASPLTNENQATFKGLDYFPPDEAWRLEAEFRPVAPERIDVPSSSGSSHPYARIGWATITLGRSTHALAVFDDGDGNAFIPFADATNGIESYGGGRYVDLVVDDEGRATIDFNEARNPYCAYDDEFVCPFPPRWNWIAARIEAGERDFRRRRDPRS